MSSSDKDKFLETIRKREEYWRRCWEKDKIFEVRMDSVKEKYFLTFPFPYMNGSLHLGHGYTATRLDVIARYKRLKGFNVLFPWAWHWTGEAVMGVCHRIEDGNRDTIERLIKLDGVPRKEIDNFKDPVYLVKYFTERGREDIKRIGFSIDWSREFHTSNLHPLYTKFVEWQIRKLYQKGYIIQGPYPVVWCPRDLSPTGDHDRMVGEGVRPEEYFLVKFKMIDEDLYLVAATFRPETIYGTTNIWLNPKAKYVIANVDGESWLVSREAARKLNEQLRKINIIKEISGREYIGKFAIVPIINRVVPILPAEFVDPNTASGVVYSVPAHAPYDWLALKDLKDNIEKLPEKLKEIVSGLYPISIISVEGYGEYPAIEICEKMNITSQMDERADEATHEIYSMEFHRGVMKDFCVGVEGLRVEEAKEVVKSMLKEKGLGDIMYDLPETVICRCGTRCIVKILEDQWSLKYSDPNWKRLAREAIDKMAFYPEEARKLFKHYVDWYKDWPCTRKTGLGTPFPYSRDWIVETLTDSTIYMAFYIISKYYNEGLINPEAVDDSFFDYIFLGIGTPENVGHGKIPPDLMKQIRKEFLYWYPVDLRVSGKDLIGNHLTFFIFHHTAIFPKELWPKSIAVNGFIKLEGKPMSKTMGIFISLRDVMDQYGADAVRVTLALAADGLEDPNWYHREAKANSYRLEGFKDLADTFIKNSVERNIEHYDRVFISRYSKLVEEVENLLDNMQIARAGRLIIYEIPAIIKGYLGTVYNPPKSFSELIVSSWIKMLSLYAPYIAEEIWHTVLGRDTYISLSEWTSATAIPRYEEDLLIEKYAKYVMDDLKAILKIYRETPHTVSVYVAEEWKWDLFKYMLKAIVPGKKVDSKTFIKDIIAEFGGRIERDKLVNTCLELYKKWHEDYVALIPITKVINNSAEEYNIFNKYITDYINRTLNLDVKIFYASDYKHIKKVRRALPLKPAYIIE